MVEVSSRKIQGRFLMRPTQQVREIIIGIIGRAQARFGMVIHAFQFLSNHFHMLLSPKDSRQTAAFMSYVKGNIAKEIGRISGWRDKFWSGRYHALVVSNEEEAQVARLKYLLSNGGKEGLVARPQDWRCASTTEARMKGRTKMQGRGFDRTAQETAVAAGSLRSRVGFRRTP